MVLQIDVEALHICKPSHHFVSIILAFHVGLRPPPRAMLYGGGRIRTDTNDDGDECGLGWAATGAKTWAGRQLAATWPGGNWQLVGLRRGGAMDTATELAGDRRSCETER